jgi:copper(I)-binding protein
MKTLIRLSGLMLLSSVTFMACQKEVSFEKGSSTASVGSLSVDATGNCLGAVVSGTYYKDTAIKASNYVDISVQVDTVGTYTITTDTVNGYYFKASGTFTATGTQVIRLIGGGKPLAAGTNIFTVSYDGTFCEFSVTVTAAPGGGGGGAAVFTVACTGATPSGTYTAGTALTASNTVTLNVNVTTIGTWSVTTAPAVNGMTFAGTGTFTNTGAQTITLTAAGTPTAAGTFTFTVTGATATCTFQCTVAAVAIPDYFPRTANSNWSYQFDGDPDDSLLIYVIAPTKTINGNTYNIFFYNDGVPPVDTFGYYRRTGGDYFEWIDMGSYVGLDDPYWMEWTFLKDNLTTGGTWTSAQFAGPYTDQMGNTSTLTLRWEFTITGQNIPVTVNGTPYTNVIEVKQELKQLVGTSWVQAAYFDCYYARDKGLIKQDLYDNTNTLLYEQDVRRLVIY